VIGWVFWRALEGGQFDDLERPAHDILADDENPGQVQIKRAEKRGPASAG
jgi:nitrogen fixation-related uncharacterized protein